MKIPSSSNLLVSVYQYLSVCTGQAFIATIQPLMTELSAAMSNHKISAKITHPSQFCHHRKQPRCGAVTVSCGYCRHVGEPLNHEVSSCHRSAIAVMDDAGMTRRGFIKGAESQESRGVTTPGGRCDQGKAIHLHLHCVPFLFWDSSNLLPITAL